MNAASQNSVAASLVEQLFDAAFNCPRDARSPEYRAGARALLDLRANCTPYKCPYAPGSASFDAFYAGVDEGRGIWRTHENALASRRVLDISADGA